MKTDLLVDFVWVPSDLGGHIASPYSGMRLSIRWQRYLEAYLQRIRDVECKVLDFDAISLRGRVLCSLFSEDEVPTEWLQDGQLIELLNGFRVLAVGKVLATGNLLP